MHHPSVTQVTTTAEHPPLTAFAIRRNTILLAASMGLAFAASQLVPSLGSLLAARLIGSPSAAGLPMGVAMFGLALGVYPAGRLMDRFGRRPVLVAGHLLALLGMLLVGGAVLRGSAAGLLLGVATLGLGGGVGLLARLGVIDLYPPEQRGQAAGYALMGLLAGAVLGPILTSTVAAQAATHGWDPLAAPWLVGALLVLLAALLVGLVRPDPREVATSYASLQRETTAAAATPSTAQPVGPAIITAGLVQAAMVSTMSVLPLVVVERGGHLHQISLLMVAHFIGMYGLSIPIGHLADRLGRPSVLGAGATLTGLGALIAGTVDGTAAMLVGLFVVGVGWSASNVAGTAVVTGAGRAEDRGRLLGRFDQASWLSGAVASLAIGPIMAASSLEVVAVACAILTLGGTTAAWLGTRRTVSLRAASPAH